MRRAEADLGRGCPSAASSSWHPHPGPLPPLPSRSSSVPSPAPHLVFASSPPPPPPPTLGLASPTRRALPSLQLSRPPIASRPPPHLRRVSADEVGRKPRPPRLNLTTPPLHTSSPAPLSASLVASSSHSSGSSPPSLPSSAPYDRATFHQCDSPPCSSPTGFVVSTIIPGFLYLGPDPTLPSEEEKLHGLGVKSILNMAVECEDEIGIASRFEQYKKIGIQDTVEEMRVAQGLQEACAFLDEARRTPSPTYVHCRAGKSRSVTVVLAYLIHANRWSLKQAYAFVLERRRGISPNIGFMAELMSFEAAELGQPPTPSGPSPPIGPPPVDRLGSARASRPETLVRSG